MNFKILSLIATCLVLAACDEHSDHHSVNKPIINYWEVVDSYGNSNIDYDHHQHGSYHSQLFIDDSIDDGYFELWWDVSSYDDYSVSIAINDTPSLWGSYEIERTYCGEGLDCDYEGFAYCFYDSVAKHSSSSHYDSLSCSTSQYENPSVDITDILAGHPSESFLIIEVCDSYSGHCSVRSQKVVFE
ncbi:hypothetical protein [Marinagarivorans cellulosilyticus]|uniref:Uncharacterized protein n=1 Tax=Marinagarivorans cellulosilyticus TaxID=2721545 RepID=A0AAN2BL67_9GAMM|nr:hypothetical protein [Marinagarivorans cellulosilyticus]BCD98717.1 hypothetical protein MARGE09_P2918 [Marinagarivorans cellulosilyticus]